MTINMARGCHYQIKDRFDLTVECIRRYYVDEPSPLSDVLGRMRTSSGFGGFGGYVEFFHLQDLVGEDGSAVGLFTLFDDFTDSPLPATLDAYVDYRQRAIEFIESRNRRIADYVTKNPLEPPPVWASQRFEAVLAHAEAVEQRELLDHMELRAAGWRRRSPWSLPPPLCSQRDVHPAG
jgi:hypothetical protein